MKFFVGVLCFSIDLACASGPVTAGAGNSVQDATRKHDELTKVWTHTQDHGWKSSFDLALNSASGNSSSGYYSAGLTLNKRRGQNDYYGRFSYAYGEDNGTKSLDELLGVASWKRTGRGGYYTGIRLDYRQDSLADIDYRLGATVLQGYELYKSEKGWVTPEIGFGYTVEKIGGFNDDKPNFYMGLHAEYWPHEKLRLYMNNTLFVPFEDRSDYYYWSEFGLEALIIDDLSFKFYLQNSYEANPAVGREAHDIRIVAGISIKL